MTGDLHAEAVSAITTAEARHPNLARDGFYPRKTWKGLLERSQASMPTPEQVAVSIAYLRLHAPKRAVRAYVLKHSAEDWGEANGMESYVPVGAVIIAAIHLCLSIRIEPKESLPGYHVSLPMNDIVWIAPRVKARHE